MKLKRGRQITLNIPGFDCVELIEELGSGGNGHVWLVKPCSSSLLQYYVLKHIRLDPDLEDKEKYEYLSRIKREASVKVNSEYIIKCLGVSKLAPDNFVLLFPYSPGQNFDEWIEEHRSRRWADKKAIFLKILEGVRLLHRAQIMHRDLKPKNILILKLHETPRIIDFGLAKFRNTESVTEVGTIAGTDAYIAPEVFGWGGIKEVDERCDIYALGIILYELIVGANPWRANKWNFGDFARYLQCTDDDGTSTYTNILDIDSQFEFDADPAVPEVIRRSTMFEPVLRFQTVDDMIGMLKTSPATFRRRWNLLRFLRHTGDTTKIARQALAREREDRRREPAPQPAAASEAKNQNPATGSPKSGTFVIRNLPQQKTTRLLHVLSAMLTHLRTSFGILRTMLTRLRTSSFGVFRAMLTRLRTSFGAESALRKFFLEHFRKLFIIALIITIIVLGGMGARSAYRWWTSHRSSSPTVEELNRMLDGGKSSAPTGESAPAGTPSPTPETPIDPDDLEELLRQKE